MDKRLVFFIDFTILALGLVYEPLKGIGALSLSSDYYSQIMLIPLVSAYLVYLDRKIIFVNPGVYPLNGLSLMGIGAVVYVFACYISLHK